MLSWPQTCSIFHEPWGLTDTHGSAGHSSSIFSHRYFIAIKENSALTAQAPPTPKTPQQVCSCLQNLGDVLCWKLDISTREREGKRTCSPCIIIQYNNDPLQESVFSLTQAEVCSLCTLESLNLDHGEITERTMSFPGIYISSTGSCSKVYEKMTLKSN